MPEWIESLLRRKIAQEEAEGARAIGATLCPGPHAQGFVEDGTPVFTEWTDCVLCGAAL